MFVLTFFLVCQLAFSDVYRLRTETALKADQTHADLIILPRLHPTTDFVIQFDFKLIKQNRKLNPNPWESFWIFWSYNKESHKKKRTNYLAFKKNGLELGKASEWIAQNFIWTDESFKIETAVWYKVVLTFKNKNLQIEINNKEFKISNELISKTYTNPGRIGLYAEDSEVEIKNYSLKY